MVTLYTRLMFSEYNSALKSRLGRLPPAANCHCGVDRSSIIGLIATDGHRCDDLLSDSIWSFHLLIVNTTMYVLGHKLKWSQNWFGCSLKHLHFGLIPIVQLIYFPNPLQLQILGTDERQGCWNHISECQHLQASTLEPAPHLPLEVLASPAITWLKSWC